MIWRRGLIAGLIAMAGFWIATVIFRRKPISTSDEDLVARLRRSGQF